MPDSPVRRESWFRKATSRVDPALLMLLVGPLMICFAWIVALGQITKDRNHALAEGYRDANGLSRSFAELVQHRLDELDQVTRVVRKAYLAGKSPDTIAGVLADSGIAVPRNAQFGVVDGNGRLVYGTLPTSLREALPEGRATVDRPSLSETQVASGDRPDTLAITRPVLRADGSRYGTVVVSVRPDQVLGKLRKLNVGPIAHQFGSVELGPDDVAAMLGVDGYVRAALLGGEPLAASRWPRGPVFFRAKDGTIQPVVRPELRILRLWSGGYLGDYDTIIVVGISRDAVLGEYERHRRIYLIGTAVFTLCVGLLTVLAAVLARRQKRTLQRLAETERRANELKSSFLAKISHDLRTPLNGILGFSELVKTTAGEADQRQYGSYIHDSASHLLHLVNMILDLTKLRNRTLRLQLREVDLTDIARSVSRTHAIVANGKGLEYRLDIAPDVPHAVMCDGVRVREVMNNLLHNAVKFTSAGSVAMSLSAAHDRVAVRVSDTGIGMSDEVKRHLFEPFSEGRDPASQAQAGSGLGLAFAKELVELHGGEIEVASVQGQGTAVTFWLPVAGPDATAPARQSHP